MKTTKNFRLSPCCYSFIFSKTDLIILRNDIINLSHDITDIGFQKSTNSYDGILTYIQNQLDFGFSHGNNNLVCNLSAEEVNLIYSISKSLDLFGNSNITEKLQKTYDDFNLKSRDRLTKRCLL